MALEFPSILCTLRISTKCIKIRFDLDSFSGYSKDLFFSLEKILCLKPKFFDDVIVSGWCFNFMSPLSPFN